MSRIYTRPVEVVRGGDVGYVKLPAIDDQLPEGKTWVRGTAGDVKAGGFDFEQLDSSTRSDPRDVLEALRGFSGDIETVGSEDLDTTHYRVVLDPVALAKRATADDPAATSLLGRLTGQDDIADVPLDVWVDGNGLVGNVSLDFEADDQSSGQPGSVSLAFELWDYGEPVEIGVPHASQVADPSSLRD